MNEKKLTPGEMYAVALDELKKETDVTIPLF